MLGSLSETSNSLRAPYNKLQNWLDNQKLSQLRRQSDRAQDIFRSVGITFNVYGDGDGVERLIPFDMVPRIITGKEWARLEDGIRQRVRAINAFLHDIYHRQEIIRAGIIPAELIHNNDAFLPQMMGVNPPGNIYTHIVGIDIVRTGPDDFFVLEDNARVPSGV
ncbi:MAG: circularly permuted type 2 ATP-grasp protein, partial [Alphaproteobacteria bacterium]|nr:circularly permuted type 2 ATP-grasp protein [Alphaproteobacteria bacterium]